MSNTWEDYWFTGRRPGGRPIDRPMSHYEHERAQTALTQRNLREGYGSRDVVDDRGRIGSGTAVHPMHHADVPGMRQTANRLNSAQLRDQVRPLQEILLGARAEGRESPEMEREPTIRAMLEMLQRPGWAEEDRQELMRWMRDFGALPPLEDQLFGPP